VIYKITATLSLSSVLPPIKELIDSMNKSLQNFGIPDKIDITKKLIEGTLTVNRELTNKEIEKVRTLITKTITEYIPGTWHIRVGYSKSCNQSKSR